MSKTIRWFCASGAALMFLAAAAIALAHPDVTTRKSDGTPAGPADPYSTKQTCGGCHFNCTTGVYSADKLTWCQATQKKDCTVAGNCPDYQSMETANVSKVQGYGTSSGTVKFENYSVTSPVHGVSTGKHSQHGRNEEWTSALRTIWGAPAFTSSPGMSGRY